MAGRGPGTPGEVTGRVLAICDALLPGLGLELVDVEFRREPGGWVLRLFIDRSDAPGRVTHDDCQRVSEELGDHLDVEDLITHPYHLEVSSPGLDRPLTRPADFTRFAGQAARITTREPLEGRRNFRGRLAGVAEGAVLLDLDEGPRV
ncbi:MAG TPA: ribosome maturation factor RimP, partial [Candidatus Sulfotelmatobacter sp.]|nr:ribosome maturation factor RimP [Candidatus Sulfotelmatobacter sp.]